MAEGIIAEFLLMLLIPVTLISFVLTGIAMGQVTQQQQTIQQLLRLSEDCRCARPGHEGYCTTKSHKAEQDDSWRHLADYFADPFHLMSS